MCYHTSVSCTQSFAVQFMVRVAVDLKHVAGFLADMARPRANHSREKFGRWKAESPAVPATPLLCHGLIPTKDYSNRWRCVVCGQNWRGCATARCGGNLRRTRTNAGGTFRCQGWLLSDESKRGPHEGGPQWVVFQHLSDDKTHVFFTIFRPWFRLMGQLALHVRFPNESHEPLWARNMRALRLPHSSPLA